MSSAFAIPLQVRIPVDETPAPPPPPALISAVVPETTMVVPEPIKLSVVTP